MKIPYFITEIFQTEKYTGNQLATFVVDESFPEKEMQEMARIFNISATSFILSPGKHDDFFNVRIFTPEKEVNFGGHSIMGSAYIIWKEVLHKSSDEIKIRLYDTEASVRIDSSGDRDRVFMNNRSIHLGLHYDKVDIAPLLGLEPDDISDKSPVREAATGLYFIIVPILTLEAMKRAWMDRRAYYKFFTGENQRPFYLYCNETYRSENSINARAFAHSIGVPEDPATGSGAAALGAYLRQYYSPVNDINLRIEQGYEIHRRSLIELNVTGRGAEDKIIVGGNIQIISSGHLL